MTGSHLSDISLTSSARHVYNVSASVHMCVADNIGMFFDRTTQFKLSNSTRQCVYTGIFYLQANSLERLSYLETVCKNIDKY